MAIGLIVAKIFIVHSLRIESKPYRYPVTSSCAMYIFEADVKLFFNCTILDSVHHHNS